MDVHDAASNPLLLELDRTSHLVRLWQDGTLVDVVLVSNDGARFEAHRIVLAAVSGFFRALFTGAWRPQAVTLPGQHPQQQPHSTGLPCWPLSGVDGRGLHLLLQSIYLKQLPWASSGEAAPEDIASLLSAANYLEVLPVKEACCQHLRSQLSLETVAETLLLAVAFDCADLAAAAARFFEGHFSQLLHSEEASSLAVLPHDLLRSLLSSDGLNIGSELDVARAVLLWAAADLPQRGLLLPELLSAARMQPGKLSEEAARAGLLLSCGGGEDVDLGLQPPTPQLHQPPQHSHDGSMPWQAQPSPQHKSPHTDEQQQLAWQESRGGPRPEQQQLYMWQQAELEQAFLAACQQLKAAHTIAASGGDALPSFRPRLSCATGLLMAGGLDDGWRPLRTVELYDPQRDAWAIGPVMPAPCSFAAAAMMGDETFVVEGAAHAPSVLAFNRQQRRWRQCAGPSTPRVNMAVAALEEEGSLFVLGGRAGIGKGAAVLREVERYCPAANSWQSAPAMALPRTSHATAALKGWLYAIGGQDSRATHASVEAFEAGAGRWVQLGARMQQPRKYLGVAAVGGRLVAVGGMTGARMRLQAAEALDPREGRWVALPPMSTARSSAGVAALHGCLYVVGGNVGADINENHAGVEAWVPSAGRWRTCAPISHGRSGLSVAPF